MMNSTKTFLLLHGYPFDHSMWDSVTPLINPEVRVIAPDIPGFGGTAVASGEPSLDSLADMMMALLDEQGASRSIVAGMSMGGYIALSMLERHAERIAGLALVSTQPYADSEEARRGRRLMIGRVRVEGVCAASAAMIPKVFADERESRDELTRIPIKGAERAGVEGICWALEAMTRRHDTCGVIRAAEIPVQVIHGDRDRIVPITLARTFSGFAKQGVFTEIPGAGHMTPIENPAAVAAGLNDLIDRAQG